MSNINQSITCKHAVDLISKKEEGRISAWQRMKLYRHFEDCSLCRLFNRQNLFLTATVSREAVKLDFRLAVEEKERIFQAIVNSAGSSDGGAK